MQADDQVGGNGTEDVQSHEELQLEKDSIRGNVRYFRA